jgi:hypothetical protein
VNAWEIAGNDSVESAHNYQFSAVFLGKITKCKKFNFNKNTSMPQYRTTRPFIQRLNFFDFFKKKLKLPPKPADKKMGDCVLGRKPRIRTGKISQTGAWMLS